MLGFVASASLPYSYRRLRVRVSNDAVDQFWGRGDYSDQHRHAAQPVGTAVTDEDCGLASVDNTELTEFDCGPGAVMDEVRGHHCDSVVIGEEVDTISRVIQSFADLGVDAAFARPEEASTVTPASLSELLLPMRTVVWHPLTILN